MTNSLSWFSLKAYNLNPLWVPLKSVVWMPHLLRGLLYESLSVCLNSASLYNSVLYSHSRLNYLCKLCVSWYSYSSRSIKFKSFFKLPAYLIFIANYRYSKSIKIHKLLFRLPNCQRSLNQSKKFTPFNILIHNWKIMIIKFLTKNGPNDHSMAMILAFYCLPLVISSHQIYILA